MTRTHAAILADFGILDMDAPPPTRRETPEARRELALATTDRGAETMATCYLSAFFFARSTT
jgi:hypothetical protein